MRSGALPHDWLSALASGQRITSYETSELLLYCQKLQDRYQRS